MLENFSNRKPRPRREMSLPKVTQWLEAELRQGSHRAFMKINKRRSPLGKVSMGTWFGKRNRG